MKNTNESPSQKLIALNHTFKQNDRIAEMKKLKIPTLDDGACFAFSALYVKYDIAKDGHGIPIMNFKMKTTTEKVKFFQELFLIQICGVTYKDFNNQSLLEENVSFSCEQQCANNIQEKLSTMKYIALAIKPTKHEDGHIVVIKKTLQGYSFFDANIGDSHEFEARQLLSCISLFKQLYAMNSEEALYNLYMFDKVYSLMHKMIKYKDFEYENCQKVEYLKYLMTNYNVSLQKPWLLYVTTVKGNFPMVNFLCANQVNVNITNDRNGIPALHAAVAFNYYDIVDTLLSFNADIYQKDKHGECALYYAKSMEMNAILEKYKYISDKQKADRSINEA